MLIELAVVFLLHADDKSEAEQLFRKMETKLANAKSLECTFEAKVEGDKRAGSMKGYLALAEGNKSRLEMSGKFADEKEVKETQICDGDKTATLEGKTPTWPAPRSLNDAYRAALTRSGILMRWRPIYRVDGGQRQPKEFKADDELKVSDFKLGKKEKVRDQEAQVVQFDLHIKELPEPLAVTVWIDTKANLPLKREIIGKIGDDKDKVTITETYSKWTIDEKIDPKKFELPKD